MFILFVLGYLIGTSSLYLYYKPPYFFYWFPIVALIFLALIYYKKYPKVFSVFLLGIFSGSLMVNIHAYLVLAKYLPKNFEKKTLKITGTVSSIPELKKFGQSFLFETDEVCFLHCYKQKYRFKLSYSAKDKKIELGERWQFDVKLKRPYSTYNPWVWDYEEYLFKERISAIGYVIAKGNNFRINTMKISNFQSWREKIIHQLLEHFSNKEYLSLFLALGVGYRGLVTQEQWQTFQYTGTNHLIAIAGLHLGFVTSLLRFMSKKLWQCSAMLCSIIPAQRACLVIAWLGGLVYSFISGLELPAKRAILMLSAYLLVSLCSRNTRHLNILAIALFLILAWDPLAILSESFWLSFFAVFAIFYGMGQRLSMEGNKLSHYFRLQAYLSLCLIPLTIYFFQVIPLMSFIVNILFIPILGFIVLPFTLTGLSLFLLSPTFSEPCISLCLKLLESFYQGLHYFSNRPAWILHWGKPDLVALILSLLGLFWLLAPRGWPLRYLGIVCCFPLFLYQPQHKLKPDEYELTVFDVGQGLSALIRTKGHTLLYDTGVKMGDYNSGDAIILPYLASNRISSLDYLILSHGDNDHSGGIEPVLKEIKVSQFLSSVPERFRKARFCQAGEAWEWDGVTFEILYPKADIDLYGNNRSCVLKVSSSKYSTLLVGDIEKPAESWLIFNQPYKLNATLLVAPHHGSKTSSSWPFVQAVHPKYLIFSTGYLNRFHFPNPKVEARYQAIKTAAFNTADSGFIQFYFGQKVVYHQWRREFSHLWNYK